MKLFAMIKPLIDLVIPTMWKPTSFIHALTQYAALDMIGKIIVIDNAPSSRPVIEDRLASRVDIISKGFNVFVNPAWNLGISHCTAELVCLANDDIMVSMPLFEFVLSLDWITPPIDLIGVDLRTPTEFTAIDKTEINKTIPLGVQITGFGMCMFLHRESYPPIPEELKIWYGDDYLAHNLNNVYAIKTPHIRGMVSATINSPESKAEFQSVITQDEAWAQSNLLRKSTDCDCLEPR